MMLIVILIKLFHQYTKWGLPSYLGFDKEEYMGVETDVQATLKIIISKNIGDYAFAS